jgi:tetratricopeptide (TPR) repeat protein
MIDRALAALAAVVALTEGDRAMPTTDRAPRWPVALRRPPSVTRDARARGRRGVRGLLGLLLTGAVLSPWSDLARAAPTDDSLPRARTLFSDGAALVKKAQWAEALTAFEQSAAVHPHPVTTYNIGACERALGRYTRARAAFHRALSQKDDAGAPLPSALAEETHAFLAEIDHLLVRAAVTIAPADAALAVDGRPLEVETADPPLLVAGIANPGPAAGTPATFSLLVGPGNHLFTLSRKGYSDIVLNRTLEPGGTPQLSFEMNRLPAHLAIASNQPAAAVSLDGLDVGLAPVTLERPAGAYRLLVRKQGFTPYEAQFTVAAGEEVNLNAALAPEKKSVVKKWWFWTAIGVGVVGAAVATYALTYTPPPYDCGGLGWCARGQ